ncbi:MAG: sigma factor, partial [Acidimicrobiales bacterium]
MTEPALPEAGTDLAGLHRVHYRSLVRLASILVDDLGVCEELVQDAFVAVLGRRDASLDRDKLPAYLRSAVLNGARSHLRRRVVRE